MQNILRYISHKNKILVTSLTQASKPSLFRPSSITGFSDSQQPTDKPKNPPRLFKAKKSSSTDPADEEPQRTQPSKRPDRDQPRQAPFKSQQDAESSPNTESSDSSKPKVRLFGEKRPEKPSKKPIFSAYFDKQKQDKPAESQEKDTSASEASQAPQGGEQKDAGAQKKRRDFRMFAKKEFGPGMILDKLAVELQKELEETPTEVSSADKNTILLRIESLKQLENVPKKFENLMELYLILEQPKNVQATYLEAEKLKIFKNPIIENHMFEACQQLSYGKAREFYNYLKSNNKLEEVFFANMCSYIELLARNDSYETLYDTLIELKNINFNLVDLDISIFNDFLSINQPVRAQDNFKGNFESVRRSEIFIECLAQILRRKPAQVDIYPSLFNFKEFFRRLNNLQYPSIKLDSNGLDICMNYLEVLGNAGILNPDFVQPADLVRWIRCYFEVPAALSKIANILSNLRNSNITNPLITTINQFTADTSLAPFSADALRTDYQTRRDESLSLKKPLSNELLLFYLELAQAHNTYDIVFDIYENYTKLTVSTKIPPFVYKAVANSFTYIPLTTQNAAPIIKSLISECETNNQQKFPTVLSTFLQVKGHIRDRNYSDAHQLYEDSFLNDYIVRQQRALLFGASIIKLLRSYTSYDPNIREYERPNFDSEIAGLADYFYTAPRSDILELHAAISKDNTALEHLIEDGDLLGSISRWEAYLESPPTTEEAAGEVAQVEEAAEAPAETQEAAAEGEQAEGEAAEGEAAEGEAEGEEGAVETNEKTKLTQADYDRIFNLREPEPELLYDRESRKLQIRQGEKLYEPFIFEAFDKNQAIRLLSGSRDALREASKLVKVRIESTKAKKSRFAEQNDKPVEDYVCDLILWGIYHNEPLAVQLGEKFYEHVGHEVPSFIGAHLNQYYKYQVTGALNRENNSFSYAKHYLTKPDSSLYFKNRSDYGIVNDDPEFDKFVNGLTYKTETHMYYHEQNRKTSIIKGELFGYKIPVVEEAKKKYAAEKKEKKSKLNLVNF